MTKATKLGLGLLIAGILLLLGPTAARAGNYYVYACSSYGNTAPAFAPFSNADHMNTADGCMEPAPNGGYRSLEINNPSGAAVAHGYGANWTASSPSPTISIVGAYTPPNTVFVDCYLHANGFTAEYFWNGGTQDIGHVSGCDSSGVGFGTEINTSFAPSSYFGWGAGCWLQSSCSTSSGVDAVLGVQGIRLTAEEDTGPNLSPNGSNNLWYQTSHWIRGGGWPVGFAASDPSGVCGTDVLVNGSFTSLDLTNDTSPDTSSFTQCWPSDVVSDTLDTTGFPNGPLSITYAANNAAGVVSNPNETLQVDNTPVTLSLRTPNDSDPNVWVNHAVTVLGSATAGPSGVAGTNCTTNDGPSYGYPWSGITLDGTGVWQVSCTTWNNSFDVNGLPATSPTQTVTVHIDETPPAVNFEPVSPDDPQSIVADTSDGQSGVANGQIEIRPAAGGDWTMLATQFDGSRLRAQLDDAALAHGQWLIQATACDNAGNCSSTQETVTLPVRTSSVSRVGLARARDSVRACAIHRPRHRRRGRALRPRCLTRRLVRRRSDRVAFGRPVLIHGVLTSGQGNPVPNASIAILTAPDNGLGQYTRVTSVTTASDGAWAALLRAGPSRLISATYHGSRTIQPSQASTKVVVPAAIKILHVWPRHIPWGGKVHIRAQLLGGFLPPGGALVRLRLGYRNAKTTYGVREHVSGDGRFEVTNAFGPGPPGLVRDYWLQECTLPESDYPFAPACGPRSAITVGG